MHYILAHALSSLALALGLAVGGQLSRPCFFLMSVAVARGNVCFTNLADHPLTLDIAMIIIRKIRSIFSSFEV